LCPFTKESSTHMSVTESSRLGGRPSEERRESGMSLAPSMKLGSLSSKEFGVLFKHGATEK